MMPNGADEKAIRQYLLGELAPEARERFEQLLLIDRDCYEHLLLLEEELVDDYVRGALPAGERKRFESYFLTTAERRQKLGFARALRRYVAGVGARVGEPAKPPLLQGLVTGWRALSPAARFSLAAALVVVVAGSLGSLAVYQGAGRFEQQLAAERARSRELAASLERERAERAALEQKSRPETLAARSETQPRPASPIFVLTAGLLRSGGETQRVVSPGSGLVELHLELAADEYPRYQASLFDAEADAFWTLGRLKATRAESRTFVALHLPSQLLPRGDYSLKLEGVTRSGDREAVGRYDFRVLSR